MSVSNEILVMALETNHILRIDLQQAHDVEGIWQENYLIGNNNVYIITCIYKLLKILEVFYMHPITLYNFFNFIVYMYLFNKINFICILTVWWPSDIEIPRKSEVKIYKIFFDPTGRHLFITTEQGENFYLFEKWKKAKALSKFKVGN